MSFASQVRATTDSMHKIGIIYTQSSWFVSLWQKVNQNACGRKSTKMLMAENQPKCLWQKINQNAYGRKSTKMLMAENQPNND